MHHLTSMSQNFGAQILYMPDMLNKKYKSFPKH